MLRKDMIEELKKSVYEEYENFDLAPVVDFDHDTAILVLMLEGIVMTTSFWHNYYTYKWNDATKTMESVPIEGARWTQEESRLAGLMVNCSDAFAWAYSDAEPLQYDQIEKLWKYYVKDPAWGSIMWVVEQRVMMPTSGVAEEMRKAGWVLDEKNLLENPETKYLREVEEAESSRKKEKSSWLSKVIDSLRWPWN